MWLRRWEWSFFHSSDSPCFVHGTDGNQLSVACGQRFKIKLYVMFCFAFSPGDIYSAVTLFHFAFS